jgi:formylglycine-generating enzyme required for sulfatase activity
MAADRAAAGRVEGRTETGLPAIRGPEAAFTVWRSRGGTLLAGGDRCGPPGRNPAWTVSTVRIRGMTTVRWLACAATLVAAPVFGVTIDFATVGDPGNAPDVATGWGGVSTVFLISKHETTNLQYMEFLNAVDPAGTNPNGVYNPLMGSDAQGGISYNVGGASGAKYAVKAGTNPNGKAYGDLPVVFTTWFSAARFANWLGNGQQAATASMENGTYTLANRTSGTMPPRNAGSGTQIAIPSRDEWFKAASYSPDVGRYLAIAGTNTITQTWLPRAANFGGSQTPTFGPLTVGTYANNRSPYGLYDVLGNVTEYTDTAGSVDFDTGRPQVFSGSWATAVLDIGGFHRSPGLFRSTTTASSQVGFRVAAVQAVPEPGMITATAVGLGWAARRLRRGGRPERRLRGDGAP